VECVGVGRGRLVRCGRRRGVDRERALVREAWNLGFYAVRSPGSGAGTAIPRPDLIVFRRGGCLELVQIKTTRKARISFSPEDWRDEVEVAERLRELGFRVSVYLDLTMRPKGRVLLHDRIRIDGNEGRCLRVFYDEKRGKMVYEWVDK